MKTTEPNELNEMSEKITDIIFNVSLAAEDKNDADLQEEIKTAIEMLSRIFVILNKIANNPNQDQVSDIDFDAQMILWQSSNALIGSLQLIRQGYTLEPQIIMRNSVENLAMALSFYGQDSESFYNRFKKMSLSGEKCISSASKLVSQIGPVYGLLSQVAHPSRKTLGYYYMEDRGTLLIGGGVTDSTQNRVKMNLAILSFILSMHWRSAELIFADYLQELVFWERVGDNQLKFKPNKDYEKTYKRSIQMFQEALAEISQEDD